MSRFMRDLATGGASCEPSDGAGPSSAANPIARVADVLLGDRGTRAREQQIQRASERDQLARGAANAANGLHLAREGLLDGVEDVREGTMRASGRYAAAPVQMVPDARLDARGASALEKSFARNRSAVMARHLQSQGEMEDGFERMRMDDAEMSARAQMAHNAAMLREMQRGDRWARGFQQPLHAQASPSSWAEEFANVETSRHAQWANEFHNHPPPPHTMHAPPRADAWAQEYRSNQGTRWGEEFGAAQNRWADEFSQQHASDVQAPLTDVAAQTAKQSSELAATLNADPKFANSKFAQLMSKLGSGQVVVREDGLQEVNAAPQARHVDQGERWAAEFVEQTQQPQPQWADQFTAQMQRQNPTSQAWAQQFSQREMESQRQSNVDDWAEEFKNVPREWASEFEDMQRNNPEWMQNVWDEMQQNPLSERSNYKFTDPNPYLGQSGLQEKTMELAKTGVLAEAALAAEAWVRQDQSNSEAWYHLGRIQAENDDDQQAIAAMSKAYEANPQNPNVLLALAVSHANELDQDEALGHACEWLGSQERFKHIAAGQAPHTPENVMAMFREAARQAPNDADVQTVLGVMAHLTRNYEDAVNAFQRAANLRPDDHSLWNKIGATQANGAESADAVGAYRRALTIKPNYVRAWSNMGISYANQGRYAESMPYYIRALSMNPNPESPTWGYVRISLGCTGRLDLLEHVDKHDIGALRREFPL